MLLGALLVCALGGPARAAPFWVSWEGNDFPENEGWERVFFNGMSAQRSLQDGALVIDSLESISIVDFYQMRRGVIPEAGETFVMQWRLRVEELLGLRDPTVFVFADDRYAAGFEFQLDSLRDGFEPERTASFSPGVFHEFEFRSTDMRVYELYIDGGIALTGDFFFSNAVDSPRIGWGDGVQGTASISRWDYFRFGVIPEPGTGIGAIVVLLLAGRTFRGAQPAFLRFENKEIVR